MGSWKPFSRFSPIKKAAVLANLKKCNKLQQVDKENQPPSNLRPLPSQSTAPLSDSPQDSEFTCVSPPKSSKLLEHKLKQVQAQLQASEARNRDSRRKLYNSQRREERAQNAKAHLAKNLSRAEEYKHAMEVALASQESQVQSTFDRASQDIVKLQARNTYLETRNTSLLKRVRRFPSQTANAVAKAVGATTTFSLKEKGVITGASRNLICDLTYSGVPRAQIPATIASVLNAAGVAVTGSVSTRSVDRIMLETYVAADLQLAQNIIDADSLTLSSDGTTHKNVQIESRHAYITKGNTHIRQFLGVSSAPSHTSEAQLQGWVNRLDGLCETYNESPLGRSQPLSTAEIACKIKGMNTDHAEDQKKLFRLFSAWKTHREHEHRGTRAILSDGLAEFDPILLEEVDRTIQNVGGLNVWEQLSAEEQKRANIETKRRATIRFGEARYTALSDNEKRKADLFVWAGCCMHKELNAVKGGNTKMMAFWEAAELTGPVLLMNRDNAAAVASGPSLAHSRAVKSSEGGGVKLTQLAGALFHHKDSKKGQQDSLRIFFEAADAVGFAIKFPDTSNTRYQSHCEAAAELLVHLPLYIQFLYAIRDKKETRRFNHLEQNVFDGLHDEPTLTELCVLALYAQAISHPYLREVRGPNPLAANILDLGPLHEQLKAHCCHIIQNPALLLSPEANFYTGAMDGKPWDRPEAVYTVLRMAPQLPHLEGALVTFFKGALETWERFTVEFAPSGPISHLTTEERQMAWMRTTNDDNEASLGRYRVFSRRAPSMSMHQYNARTITKSNGTSEYVKRQLDDENRAYIRKKARILDGSGLEKHRHSEIAEADRRAVEVKRERDAEQQRKVDQKNIILDRLTLLLNVEDIKTRAQQRRITVVELDLQLDWHRKWEGKDTKVPLKSRMPRKDDRVRELCAAVERNKALLETVEVRLEAKPEGSTEGGHGTRTDE